MEAAGAMLWDWARMPPGELLQSQHCGTSRLPTVMVGCFLPGLRLLLVKDASKLGLYSEVSFRNPSSFGFFSNVAFTFSQNPARSGTPGVYLSGCLLVALD